MMMTENRKQALLELNGPWRFRLKRATEFSSDKVPVADGVQFADKTCVLRWLSQDASTAYYTSHAALMRVHGHEGATECEWLDAPPTEEFRHGSIDCYQDSCENCHFASIGGLEARSNPKPKYAKPGQEAEYLRGYIAGARAQYGDDWATREFNWAPAIVVGQPASG